MNQSPLTNLWWPEFESGRADVEAHMLGRVNDVDVVIPHVRTKGIAVQAGGHVGLWARQLAKHFTFVHTFEASGDMFDCLYRNVGAYPSVIPTQAALGRREGTAKFSVRRAGRSKIDPAGDETVLLRTIDSLQLPRCDLLYLDIEGHELDALAGAMATITKFRPVIALEVLKGREQETSNWVSANGYTRAQRIHNDWIFTP